MAPHARPSGLYKAVYYVLDKQSSTQIYLEQFWTFHIEEFWICYIEEFWICYIEEIFCYIEEHIFTWKKSFHANFFFSFAFNGLQIILLAPPWCKDSKNEIRFEIGPWEGGEKIGHTYKQTDRQTDFREF